MDRYFNTEPVEEQTLRQYMVLAVVEEGITVLPTQAALFNALLDQLAKEPSVVEAFYRDEAEEPGQDLHCRRAIRTALFDAENSPNPELLEKGRQLRQIAEEAAQ